MNTSRAFWSAIVLAALVGVARCLFECGFVVPLVPDPQSPIWMMVSLITSLIVSATVLPLALIAFRGQQSQRALVRCAACVPLFLLLGWYSIGFINLARMRAALLDSANANTGSERLRELADYRGGPGYEVDNRLASHPNTPPDVLRALHGRPDQVGTEMCLAENPNTPDDVLRRIAARRDEWAVYLGDALRKNPRYREVFPSHDPEGGKKAEQGDAADSR
jgi:hypothetical protein